MPPDLVKWGTLIASASAVDQASKASAAAEATRTEVRATRAELADLKRGLAVEAEAKEALRRLKQLVYEKRKQLDKAATLVQTNPMGAFMLTARAVSALQGLDASMFEDFADKEYYDSAIEKAGDLSRQMEAKVGQDKLRNLTRIMKLAEQCSSADYAITQLYPIVQNAKGNEKEKAVSKLVKVATARNQSYCQLSALVEEMPELNATNFPFLISIEQWKQHKKEQAKKALLEFQCMILLCKADGKIAPEEKEQILSFGKKIGLSDSEISETFSATRSLSFKGSTHTHGELVGLFVRLADVAQADGVVAPEEHQILATLAKAFDLSKKEINSAVGAESRAERYRRITTKHFRGITKKGVFHESSPKGSVVSHLHISKACNERKA